MSDEDKSLFDSMFNFQSADEKALGSLFEQKLGQLGIGALHNNRSELPDDQVKAIARSDVNQHGGPEHLNKISPHQAQIYMNSFNEVQQQILNKDEGYIFDESHDDWKARQEDYIGKQKQWMEKQSWNTSTEPSPEKSLEPLELEIPEADTTPIDPFENTIDEGNPLEGEPIVDASVVDTDDWDAFDDVDDIDDIEASDDPFA